MKQMDENAAKIKIILGLGNPDPNYNDTYHNAGFLFIDYLQKNISSGSFPPLKFKTFKSEEYMNESGRYAKKIIKKYGAKRENVLIVHDDSDISIGSYKLSFDRGGAGHKGVQSVIHHLGGKDFWRLRLGVRGEKEKGQASEFVLKKIKKADGRAMQEMFGEILKNEPLFGKEL